LAIGIVLSAQNIEPSFFEDTKYKQLTLTFPNGSQLIGLPANPRTARGCSGNVTLDEFGHHHDSRAIWQAVHPLALMWGYYLRIISTPNGLQGEYSRIWTGAEKLGAELIEQELRKGNDPVADDWSRHLINIDDASAQGHPVDVAKCREMAGDEDTFQQEYMCKFLDEAYAWLPYSLLDHCTHKDATIYWDSTQKPAGPIWAGLDIGRKHDLTTLWLNEQRGDVHTTRGVLAMKGETFNAQKQTVQNVMPFVSMLNGDETGIGAQLMEELVEYWGESRVEGISFTGDRPAKLATKLRSALEQERLWLPDDAALATG
jgi:phage FluMu gp28-like protein